MLGESTPIVCGVIPAFEMFMMMWEKIIQDHPNLAHLIQPGLDWAGLGWIGPSCTMAKWTALKLISLICISEFIS
jgi:hypothetical protein